MHPGKLPNYRGSSAPELQIMDQNDLCSFHLINDKIDSGKLIYTKKLDLDYSSYENEISNLSVNDKKFIEYYKQNFT